MSVQRLSVLTELGLDPVEVMLEGFPRGWGLAALKVADVRAMGKGVMPDVTAEDGPAHAIVEDLTGGQRRKIAVASTWFVAPIDCN